MKTLLLLLLLFMSMSASAQKPEALGYSRLPVDSTTHLVTYSSVIPVAGVGQQDLYLRAREWAARSFEDSKGASRMEDKEAGTLVCHGIIKKVRTSGFIDNGGMYGLTLAVYTKDGRYKYVIDQITFSDRELVGTQGFVSTYRDGPFLPVEDWAKFRSAKLLDKYTLDLDERVKLVVQNLAAAMAGKPTSGGAKSDW